MMNTERVVDGITDPIRNTTFLVGFTGLSRATIHRMRRRGEFPEPIRLSPGRCGWRQSTIDEWLAGRDGSGVAHDAD